MLIILIAKKKKKLTPAADTGEDNDLERDETIKNFHPAIQALNAVNVRDIIMENGDLLAPVYSVGLYSNAQN